MNNQIELSVKYRSSPNIAWVKYWGKFDEDYILPLNDSLGVTLDQEDINTETTVTFSKNNEKDCFILNEEEHKISSRMSKIFNKIKTIAYEKIYKKEINVQQWQNYHFKIQSVNSFPTASGIASSASGLACLAVALNGLFSNILNQIQISELARLGSGSASRSIYGGLVRWKGVSKQILMNNEKSNQLLEKLSKQCISQAVIPSEKLSFIKVIILLENMKKKKVSSTDGMASSVQTSELIQFRNQITRKRISSILTNLHAIQTSDKQSKYKNFNQIMQNIIKDSNQFHAICLDTYPPILYLTQFSKQIMYIVDRLLNPSLKYKIGYTFDAGPHAFLFLHQEVEIGVLKYFHEVFKLPITSYNGKAAKKIREGEQEIHGIYQFQQYDGEVIQPWQIWSTSIGPPPSRIM